MPMYTFECQECSETFDVYKPMEEVKTGMRLPCPACKLSSSAVRLFVPGKLQVNAGFKPYFSQDFDGEPHWVATQREEDALCRVNRVKRVTSEEMLPDTRKKKRVNTLPPLVEDLKRTANDLKYGACPPPPRPVHVSELERIPV